jgi:hypothetical protein
MYFYIIPKIKNEVKECETDGDEQRIYRHSVHREVGHLHGKEIACYPISPLTTFLRGG